MPRVTHSGNVPALRRNNVTAHGSGDGKPAPGAPSNTGLGKGLSGIIGDFAEHSHAKEVSALLGSSARRNSPEVRRIVAELAVDTMSSAFSADGVLMARLGADGRVDPLQTRLAGTWAPSDPLGFEVNGRLWNCLTERTSVQGQVPVGRLHVLFARHKIGAVVIASAVVRSREFSRAEQDQLAGLIRSAARATEVEESLPETSRLRVETQSGGKASVELEVDGKTLHGSGTGNTDDAAVANATIAMFDLDVDLRFAGSTVVDGDHVTIVVLNGGSGTVFGLAVTGADSERGAVEATFSAAISAGLAPLDTTPAT